MLYKISRYCTKFLVYKNVIKIEEIPIYEYGFQLFFSTLFGCISIYVLSLVFFEIAYALLFFLFFMPLRTFVGGYHCKTYSRCFIVSNMYFFITASINKFIASYYLISFPVFYIMILIPVIYIFFRAPIIPVYQKVNSSSINRSKKFSKCIIIIESICILLYIIKFNSFEYALFAVLTMYLNVVLMEISKIENRIIHKSTKNTTNHL